MHINNLDERLSKNQVMTNVVHVHGLGLTLHVNV